MTYFAAFRNWLRERANTDKDSIKRPPHDYPFYADDPVEVFPYRHSQLWTDVPAEVLAAYVEVIDQLYNQAAQADLARVRNALDHKREESDFPTADKILACVSRLEQMLELADANRLMPKLFWTTREEHDVNGNVSPNGGGL